MNTELKIQEPTLYKNIKISVDQYAITRTALSKLIENTEKHKEEFIKLLNGSKSTVEVRNNQWFIRICKDQIRDAKATIKLLDASETITEHKLY